VLETYFGAGSNQYEVLLKLNDKNQKLKLTIDRVSGQLVSVAFIDPRQVDCNVADKAFTAKYGREPSPQDYLDLLDAQYEYGVIEEPRYADLAKLTIANRQSPESLHLFGKLKEKGRYQRIAILENSTALMIANCPSGVMSITLNNIPYSTFIDQSSSAKLQGLFAEARIADEKAKEKRAVKDVGDL
jgi:hypothetical protein